MNFRRIFVLSVCSLFTGCWLSNHDLPLPPNDSGFPGPVRKPFKFSAAQKAVWNSTTPIQLKPGKISRFDINKLPEQPFNKEGFQPVLNAPSQNGFYYNNLPDTILNLEGVPDEPLVFKTSLLGIIKHVILGQPKIESGNYFTSFHFTSDQGLPSQHIRCSLHSRDGLYWIMTDQGLVIINGESVEILPNNYGQVYFMIEDKDGVIWIRSEEKGLVAIDRRKGIQMQADFPDGVGLNFDKKGSLWLPCFDKGVYKLSADRKSFKHFTTKNGLGSGYGLVCEDKEGRIWLSGTDSGIDILDPVLKKIKRFGPAQGLQSAPITCFSFSKSGEIFLAGIRGGIDIVNPGLNTLKHFDSAQGLKRAFITQIAEDDQGRHWIGADSAVYILNKNNDSVAHFEVPGGANGGPVISLEKDRHNQIVVSSFFNGLYFYPPDRQVAHLLTNGLIDKRVWNLLEDSMHRKWISTYSGYNILTPDHKLKKLLPSPAINDRTYVIQTGPEKFALTIPGSGLWLVDISKNTIEKIGLAEGLPRTDLSGLFMDNEGYLWMAIWNEGVLVFDPVKRTVRAINSTPDHDRNRVVNVEETSPGKYWISTYGSGIFSYDLKENTQSVYSTKEGLSNNQITDVVKDKQNRYWLATEDGINLLDPFNGTNTVFSLTNGLSAKAVYSLLEDGNRMYVGTGNGLTCIQEDHKPGTSASGNAWDIQTYGRPQGFSLTDFNGRTAMKTSTGEFWWGIVNGITTIDQSAFQAIPASVSANVSGIDFFGKPHFFTDPGTINNTDTIWYQNKDSFHLKRNFALLNSDKSNGIDWDSLNGNFIPVNLSLPPDRNYLRFHFSNSLPQNEGEYKYIYMLSGVDEKWSPVTELPVTENYNNISPGYYTFRVSVKKTNGPWSEPSVYHFRIRPPWWYSWWAELIYLFIFLGLLRFWVGYRSRQLQKENMLLEQKITERTTALSASLENLRQAQGQLIQAEKMASLGELTAGIAHEIQNPLNFVNNFSEVNTELIEDVNKALELGDVPEAKEILKDLEMNMGKITFHGKRADAIVKGMLLHSRASSGQKIPTDVNALADEYLRLSYHGLRAKDKSFNAQFTMNLDEKLEEVMLVQQDIGRVLLNLFNNAFYSVTEKKKLAPAGYEPTVSLSTKKKPDSVEIRIRDNGVGIPKRLLDKIYQPFFTTKPAGQGTGLGLSLSYDIITKEHGGKIDVVTKENEFTEFIIELPLQA